jgi:hypothetical protein
VTFSRKKQKSDRNSGNSFSSAAAFLALIHVRFQRKNNQKRWRFDPFDYAQDRFTIYDLLFAIFAEFFDQKRW